MGGVNVRSIILDMLIQINEENKYSNLVVRAALDKYAYLPHEDRAFMSRVALGTTERKITVDYIIDSFSKISSGKMKPVIRNILRMGVYQIMYMDSVEDYAACSEAVKLSEKRGFGSLKGFVNGVLRNIARNRENIKFPSMEKEPVKCMSVLYSTPEWIVRKWVGYYGCKVTEEILRAQFEDRSLDIRCNTVKISPEELKNRLEARGIRVNRNRYIPEALSIDGYDSLDRIPEFDEGLFFVQDAASMLIASAACPPEDGYVIDLCAAPGGKSTHMAQLIYPGGTVDARDISEAKTCLIEENVRRLGLSNVTVRVSDATMADEASIGKADVVIADLPCSGLGIIGKKPDIKYNASEEGCHELAELQRKILHMASQYVRKGGRLIYSTCTLNREENEENAEWFADNHDYIRDDMEKLMPEGLRGVLIKDNHISVLPGESGMDGFFISAFTRKQD